MSDNIAMIKELLDYVESYEKEVGNFNIKEFSIYLKDKLIKENKEEGKNTFDRNNYENYKTYQEIEFSTLLTGLYRFAKHYIKKALINTSFKAIDEFGFLATLLKEKSLLKNELINKHLLEISSGSEILKRLIKSELIYEYPDQNDKRAKRVSLTEKGTKEIFTAFDEMHKVSEIIIGNLNNSEINEALSVFNKLTYFHNHIHEKDRNSSIDDLYVKYIKNLN
ncbi:MAG: winged helix-turn-helix transcriptional regulator [Bacteroidales bacterium]|nr:winged helix-turn-helix transcriptional regulator [Bacteroidales bacterium]MBN2757056.1 winged helix-turn-helix transcriptional regulator [Bacteroidales bacterium]